ncbi:amidase [Loktanella sp. SALINAS62]|uniref:amidase n=1 Tax=Loktanella sp. SALINAS62 TaxID=2706124 RepID=UPI001B8BBDA8|nr:amidase [Loktanella sp. SALINAS62]MBS1301406.1 amidase [Loktanella sp. SALINAS62]
MTLPPLPTIAALRAALDAGRVTANELTQAAVDQARVSTAFASVRVVENTAGPLAGIPLAHKDMFDRPQERVGMGAHPSAAITAGGLATVLSRLDAAGQVDIGRLAMSEFAMGPSGHNAHHGMPDNPLVPGAITGGSSSGSGVAVGAGIVPAALGSDTGGSIRIPAACSGVVGFKPTQGLVPVDGAMPLSWTQDCVGPLAASVDCAATILSIIAGQPIDDAGGPLRIGLLAGPLQQAASDRMQAAMADVARLLEHAGHGLTDIPLAFFDDLTEPANIIAISEAATVHADRLQRHAETYGPQVRARLVQAAAIPAQSYLRAGQIRQAARQRMVDVFGDVDIILMPTLADVPPQGALVDIGNDPELNRVIAGLTRFTRPASILGLPSLSLPVTMTSDGPLSLQVMGPAFADGRVARVANAIETALALRAAPPSF